MRSLLRAVVALARPAPWKEAVARAERHGWHYAGDFRYPDERKGGAILHHRKSGRVIRVLYSSCDCCAGAVIENRLYG